MSESNTPDFEVPKGNLEELANNNSGQLAVGIISIVWCIWIAVSMLVSWQNSAYTGTWDTPITYIWTFTTRDSVWESWLPLGYFSSWVINGTLFFVELIAWFIGGDFFRIWAHVGLWGGLVLAAFPWICELAYILSEYPTRNSSSPWKFIFWSAEFWMLGVQGALWLISWVLHAFAIGPLVDSINARKALNRGITNECKCLTCTINDDSFTTEQKEAICTKLCEKQCPQKSVDDLKCDVKKYENESFAEHEKRLKECVAKKFGAQSREDADEAASALDDSEEEDAEEDDPPIEEPIDDISSPDDEW